MFRSLTVILYLLFCFQANANILLAREAIENKDYPEAKQQLEKLATIGNAEAQYTLGLMHYQGQAGGVNKIEAFVWLFLASEYDTPDATAYASKVFQELTKSQKTEALAKAKEYSTKFGAAALIKEIYPILTEEKIAKQKIVKPAKELSRIELRSDDLAYVDKVARANNARVDQSQLLVSRINTGYRHNAFDNFGIIKQDDISGLVIIKHGVDIEGNVLGAEVIFSFPHQQFEEPVLDSVLKSKFSSAIGTSGNIEQYGLVTSRRIGAIGPNSFRDKYPLRYREFLKVKRKALNEGDESAKYRYANLLRAYGDIIAAEQPTSYQELLKELSESGVMVAQFDYAQYLMYEESDLDMGLYWLVEAAKAGHVGAEYRLGDILLNSPSEYLLQDKKKAEFWLDRATQKGHKKAEQLFAKLKLNGGVKIGNRTAIGM